MKKKLLSIMAALSLCLCILCSCGSKSGGGILKIDGKDVKVQNILKVGDREISYDMYRYWFLSVKASMLEENSKLDFTKEENLKTLKEQTLKQIKFICATRDIADKYGVKLSAEHLSEIEKTMKETFESAGSADTYLALLAENFLTDEVYGEILEVNSLYDYMQSTVVGTDKTKNQVVFTTEDALKRCEKDFYRLVDIYFFYNTEDEEGNALSAAQIEKNKKEAEKKINSVYSRVQKGENFLDIVKEYRGDEEYEVSLQGYYDPHSFEGSFDYDVASMKIGDTSAPIVSNNTFIMIHRLENDNEYLTKNGISTDGYTTITVEDYYAQELFGEMVEERMGNLKITELEYYDKITPETLF